MRSEVPLFCAAEVRELDRIAIEDRDIPGYTLMSRAGEAAFEVLKAAWPDARRVAVFCGGGNNGGDGYVVARLAKLAGLDVCVMHAGEPDRVQGDARTALEAAGEAGVAPEPLSVNGIDNADVLVDALLGTGLERPVSDSFRDAVQAMNTHPAPVLAIDIPTGLHADTGAVLGDAVRASHTVTFIGRKRGLYTGFGPEFTGAVHFANLGVPQDTYSGVTSDTWLYDGMQLRDVLPRRPRSQHKGANGHVLVIGGDYGMAGAARLASEAAARTGAGLVSVATHREHVAVITGDCPEVMSHGIETGKDLLPLLERATTLAIGPGLGTSAWSLEMFNAAMQSELPMVIDADGLNLLARQRQKRENRVLTPHPGEAARLLRCTADDIQQDRFAAVNALVERYGGIVLLKGVGTVVGDGNSFSVCPAGNPGMASGGMGDVLTGVIAGLLAQGLTLAEAATAGAFVHGAAADVAAGDSGERGLLARDVIAGLRQQVNPCR